MLQRAQKCDFLLPRSLPRLLNGHSLLTASRLLRPPRVRCAPLLEGSGHAVLPLLDRRPRQMVMKVAVHLERCVAARPTFHLKGSSEAYDIAELTLSATLAELASSSSWTDLKVDLQALSVNQLTSFGTHDRPTLHRAAPTLAGKFSANAPRIGAFEVSYTLCDANGLMRRAGVLFSKLMEQRWPNFSRLTSTLQAAVAASAATSASACAHR